VLDEAGSDVGRALEVLRAGLEEYSRLFAKR
jgi:hypothetical protein